MRHFLKIPHIKRKMLVFLGDLSIMSIIVASLIFLHHLLIDLDILKNPVRPLKVYVFYPAIPIFILMSYIFEIYDIKKQEKLRTFTTLTIVSAASFAVMFALAKVLRINRTTIIYIFAFFAVSIFLLYGWRSICRRVLLATRRFIKQKVLFIGIDRTSMDLITEMKSRDYNLAGCLLENETDQQNNFKGLRILGSYNDLNEIAETTNIDIIVTSGDIDLPLAVVKKLYEYKHKGRHVYDSSYFYELLTRKVAIGRYTENERIPYFNIDAFSRPVLLKAKRILDLLGALSVLILLSPLFVIVMILVKLTSKGPILFTQQRLGFQEKPFQLMKFRTMIQNAEKANGPQWSSEKDDRITKVGKFLRKTRLDELPQLINICKGDMSFIGPRPIRRHFADLIEEQMPFYSLRFTVKPGLTGWAQVNYDYGGSVEGHIEKFQYDLYYIRHASIFLDIFIIVKTIQTIVCRPAY